MDKTEQSAIEEAIIAYNKKNRLGFWNWFVRVYGIFLGAFLILVYIDDPTFELFLGAMMILLLIVPAVVLTFDKK